MSKEAWARQTNTILYSNYGKKGLTQLTQSGKRANLLENTHANGWGFTTSPT